MIVLQSPHIGLVILDTTLQIQPAMLQLRLLQQGLIALLVRTLPPPPVMNQNKISNLENTRPTNITRKKPVQPRHPPPASTQINRTVLTTTEAKRMKTCTAPPPTPG